MEEALQSFSLSIRKTGFTESSLILQKSYYYTVSANIMGTAKMAISGGVLNMFRD